MNNIQEKKITGFPYRLLKGYFFMHWAGGSIRPGGRGDRSRAGRRWSIAGRGRCGYNGGYPGGKGRGLCGL